MKNPLNYLTERKFRKLVKDRYITLAGKLDSQGNMENKDKEARAVAWAREQSGKKEGFLKNRTIQASLITAIVSVILFIIGRLLTR